MHVDFTTKPCQRFGGKHFLYPIFLVLIVLMPVSSNAEQIELKCEVKTSNGEQDVTYVLISGVGVIGITLYDSSGAEFFYVNNSYANRQDFDTKVSIYDTSISFKKKTTAPVSVSRYEAEGSLDRVTGSYKFSEISHEGKIYRERGSCYPGKIAKLQRKF